MNFNSIKSVMSSIMKLLNIPKPPDPPVPTPLILASFNRTGLSAQKLAAEVIRRRAEAGLPVGNLPDGSVNPDELMELIRMQVLIDALVTEARITVAINAGIPILATGTDATGSPVVVNGLTTLFGSGSAIIQ